MPKGKKFIVERVLTVGETVFRQGDPVAEDQISGNHDWLIDNGTIREVSDADYDAALKASRLRRGEAAEGESPAEPRLPKSKMPAEG